MSAKPRSRVRRPDFDDWTALVLIAPLAFVAWVLGHHDLGSESGCGFAGRFVTQFGHQLIGGLVVVLPVLAVVAASQIHRRPWQHRVFFAGAAIELGFIAITVLGPYDGCV